MGSICTPPIPLGGDSASWVLVYMEHWGNVTLARCPLSAVFKEKHEKDKNEGQNFQKYEGKNFQQYPTLLDRACHSFLLVFTFPSHLQLIFFAIKLEISERFSKNLSSLEFKEKQKAYFSKFCFPVQGFCVLSKWGAGAWLGGVQQRSPPPPALLIWCQAPSTVSGCWPLLPPGMLDSSSTATWCDVEVVRQFSLLNCTQKGLLCNTFLTPAF